MTLKKLTNSNKLTSQQEQFIELYCDNEHKLTQQEIADKLGVSRKTVSRWKNDPGPVRTEIEKKEKLRALGLLSLANNAMEDILQNGSDTARVKAAEYALRMNGLLQNGASEELTKEVKQKMTVEEALQKYGMGGSTIKEAEKADFPQLDQPHVSLEAKRGTLK
ncbi:phBC6A51 family helix-turn-helix protein [Enterococcus asini]|uniref:phBC6A51 family helix-turn-helix protein n=1 Tax=Enterococcus asini TaxID=57732 RepID=UPI001E2AD5A0|nr:phBC6A51 family helix-turn-helix protein [Enterococcus asini]MCD5028613.1 helix-turn-helix domain-containing protein [Enterococcus asini]